MMSSAFIVFGSTKLPQVARGLGSAKTEYERVRKVGRSALFSVREDGQTDSAA
jgi:hypothetical protein